MHKDFSADELTLVELFAIGAHAIRRAGFKKIILY